MVLFVDDLQWADTATVDLLRYLLFRFESEDAPLLLLAAGRSASGARAAAELDRIWREPRCATLLVGSLSDLEATELAGFAPTEARRLFGRDPDLPSATRQEYLTPWSAAKAEKRFLARFKTLHA